MATSIHYSNVKSAISGGYRVAITLSSPVGFTDAKILLAKYSDNSFDHVGSVYDLLTYPGSSTSNFTYYRVSTINVDFLLVDDSDALALATSFSTSVVSSLQDIVNEWEAYNAAFVGTSAATLTNT